MATEKSPGDLSRVAVIQTYMWNHKEKLVCVCVCVCVSKHTHA